MNSTAVTEAPQALVKVTQGRRGMLLTDSFVVTRPVIFNLAPPEAPRRREGVAHPGTSTDAEQLR